MLRLPFLRFWETSTGRNTLFFTLCCVLYDFLSWEMLLHLSESELGIIYQFRVLLTKAFDCWFLLCHPEMRITLCA
jgi:hypothetical protein